MSKLLDLASSFAAAIANKTPNCYSYGWAVVSDGQIVPRGKPGQCTIPASIAAAGADIGWPSTDGFALVGMDANAQPLAFTDCTGFAAWLIAQASPDDFTAMKQWDAQNHGNFAVHAQPWPSAAAYAFAGYSSQAIGGNWSVVVTGNDSPDQWTELVQPGDLLAWDIREIAGVPNDTGHILVLSSTIENQSPGVFQVDVIDSSVLPHGNDSRVPPQTGVGTGTIALTNTVVQQTSVWEYSFGVKGDCFHIAPHISVLRLNV